jgi:catechol-2,3-dioxygenase
MSRILPGKIGAGDRISSAAGHRAALCRGFLVPMGFPRLHQVVLDTTDTRGLAEFYRQLLGLDYRAGDEPAKGRSDWLVLLSPGGGMRLAFQEVDELRPATWPKGEVPQQLHVDTVVDSAEELAEHHERALGLGAVLLLDRHDDSEEPLYVYADPAGHPFCIFVA